MSDHTTADSILTRLNRYVSTPPSSPDECISFEITRDALEDQNAMDYATIKMIMDRTASGKFNVPGFDLSVAVADRTVIFKWAISTPLRGPQEGIEGDIRVSDVIAPDNPFVPRYRRLTIGEAGHHDDIKNAAMQLLDMFKAIPKVRTDSGQTNGYDTDRNLELARGHLEDAVYRAVKALTA